MQDPVPPIDPSFERWTQLSDAYEQHLLHMKQGDAEARAEAIRLARELDALTRLHGRKPPTQPQGDNS